MRILPENDCLSMNVAPIKEEFMSVEVKSVKINLGELKNISASLTKILSQDMPVLQAYRMTKLAKSADKELKVVEDLRIGLVKKYGETNEQGNVEVKGRMSEFITEFNELLSEEVEISFIPINIDDLGDIKLSPVDLMNIDMFLVNEEG